MNAVDEYGNTALMFAAIRGNSKSIVPLISAGANVTIVNKEGNTALTEAIRQIHSRGNYEECVKLLIKAGVDVNAVDECGYTALMFIANPGNSKHI